MCLKVSPGESPLKMGSHFLIMSLSLKVLLDHIADYLFFLSDAPLFWFTLNTSYDHAFHDMVSSCVVQKVPKIFLPGTNPTVSLIYINSYR